MIEDTKETKWYTISVQTNREKSVSEKIKSEIERGNLKDVVRTLVPTKREIISKNNKKVEKETVLYPGYIFVEVTSTGELQYLLKNMNGASGFVKDRSGSFIPISAGEVRRMLGEVRKNSETPIEIKFIKGETVNINEGPFSGFKATINELNDSKNKVKLSVSIFGRSNDIELDINQINKIDA